MNQLVREECNRVGSVLDEALRSIEILELLPEHMNFDELYPRLDSKGKHRDVTRAIERLNSAQVKYIAAVKSKSRDKITAGTLSLHAAVREVVRELNKMPSACSILQRFINDVNLRESKYDDREERDTKNLSSPDMQHFFDILNDYKVEVRQCMMVTVEEEQARKGLFYNTQEKISELAGEFEALSLELKHEESKEVFIAEKQSTLERLEGAIQDIQRLNLQELQSLAEESKITEGSHETNFQEKRNKLLDQYDNLSKAFLEESGVRGSIVDSMSKKVNRATLEVNALIEQYDAVMMEKSREYEDMKRRYAFEQKRFRELDVFFRRIDKDLAIEAEEERAIARESFRQKNEQKRLTNAILKIQIAFRLRLKEKKKQEKKGGKQKAGNQKAAAKGKKK